MTQDEIIEMARQAGIRKDDVFLLGGGAFEAFAKLVDAKATAREREACAKAFEAEADTWIAWPQRGSAKRKGAEAIRARGGEK
jgi:hypothetical protein